ncbi:MAG: SLBB domain-containing protein [Rhodospirillales bacterium]|nr:SLBB domain-containing protein [Rhodospirillales bacterium]
MRHGLILILLLTACFAQPAWSQLILPDEQQIEVQGNTFDTEERNQSTTPIGSQLAPFGSSLFKSGGFPVSQSADLSSPIAVGNAVSIELTGAVETSLQTAVDPQGNVFIPELGPIQVAGVQGGALNQHIKTQVNEVYGENVDSYATILDSSSIGVFVTGYVDTPGRFPGTPGDSVIDYLARAGGILPASGSYRNVAILRNGQRLYTTDLYSFLLHGSLRKHLFVSGDTILVGAQRPLVAATGAIRNSYAFEFGGSSMSGGELNKLARPLPNVSHVLLEGSRNGQPYSAYVDMKDFETTALQDQDIVTYYADRPRDTIQVALEGTYKGESLFIVDPKTTLVQLLDYVPVEPELSAYKSVSLKRLGVAEQQKALLDASLNRLEQTLLTARSLTDGEASIRTAEAALLMQYIERARQATPEGIVVLAEEDGTLADVRLEDGDIVMIPSRTTLVNISGEVRIPQTMPFYRGKTYRDYVEEAGGYTDRADEDFFIVLRLSGAVELQDSASNTDLEPGDVLVVPPEVKPHYIQLFLGLLDVVARASVLTAVIQ